MFEKTYAAETGDASPGAGPDVKTELIALQADIRGLVESVQRLAVEAPSLAREGVESSIRREPVRAVFIAAGIGFVLSLIAR